MAKWTSFTNIDTHFRLSWVFVDHSLDRFLGLDILFMIRFNEDVADICSLDFTLSDLNFGATIVL